MLLVGAASLLLGGVAGGLVDRALQPDEARPVLVQSSAPAVPGGQAADTEAILAQNFTAQHAAPGTDTEAILARNFTAQHAAPGTDIEAVRAHNYVAPPHS
jgi:hypothetical protein